MNNDQNEPELMEIETLKLDQFQSGDQLAILCGGDAPTFIAFIVDPQKGQAIVRPAVTGQFGAGYRDAKATLGSRPLQEGSKPHVSKKTDPETRWGELVFGHELVLRNEDTVLGTDGRIFYTGQQLTAVRGPQTE